MDGLRPTIVWDVDDVLNDLMAAWLEAWAPAHGDRSFAWRDVRENPPHRLLGIESRAYLASLDAFRTSDRYASLEPNATILAWLEAHGDRCHHIALTATAFRAAPSTAAWVLRHFGRWIREFAFVPAVRAGEDIPRLDADKGAWLSRLAGPAVLVDDAPSNLEAATRVGVSAIRWPQPWNGVAGRPEDALAELDRWVNARVAA